MILCNLFPLIAQENICRKQKATREYGFCLFLIQFPIWKGKEFKHQYDKFRSINPLILSFSYNSPESLWHRTLILLIKIFRVQLLVSFLVYDTDKSCFSQLSHMISVHQLPHVILIDWPINITKSKTIMYLSYQAGQCTSLVEKEMNLGKNLYNKLNIESLRQISHC